jgi:hypothetical protein
MKKNLFTATAFSIVTIVSQGSAEAQSKFEGLYGQVGVGYESTQTSLTYGNVNVTGTGPAVGSYPMSSSVSISKSFTGTATIGYMFPMNKDFLLGIGAEYSPINGNSQNFSASGSGLTANGQYNKENSYNIFLSPAFSVGDDGLLYGKVGYTVASVKSQYSGGSSTNDNLNGYSLGIGYKQMIQGGFYAFGEFNYANYRDLSINQTAKVDTYQISSNTVMSATTYNFLLGVGYKF